jgi:hypothetical protein
MSLSIDALFARNGVPIHPTARGPACPADEAFAAYLDPRLPVAQRESIELHALSCADCHDLLRMMVDLGAEYLRLAVAPAVPLALPSKTTFQPPAALRIAGRLFQRGIELLNHAELTFRVLAPEPVRGSTEAPAAPELVAIRGPGSGLDEFELQAHVNGTVSLRVRCENMPALSGGEIASITLEDIDGSPREKRPFAGEKVSFAPIGRGHYRVRLVARAPGGPARPLAEATLELTA